MVKIFAPAKVNLTLHVTGQRSDGYHELDSLAVFADIGDVVRAKRSDTTTLTVTGPMAASIPTDSENLVMKAAALIGVTANIELKKNLPPAAGLGGGSSDAAATLKALSQLSGKSIPTSCLPLGADVPVCLSGAGAARMRGIGDVIEPIPDLPPLYAVLVNPNVPVMTVEVFRQLRNRINPPMPEDLPRGLDAAGLVAWLSEMRNDLEAAAIEAEPVIAQVFSTLEVTPGCQLTRMSGSGGTCFGIYGDAETAASAEGRLREQYPSWWIRAAVLNAPA